MHIDSRDEIEEEVTGFLSNLIKINTTNPPGNETQAAKFVANHLSQAGFKCEIIESSPSRGNLITRLKGTGEKPSLLLLSHLDVVGADAKAWSVDPFGGVIKDGFVWGRGALDMKGMTAIETVALKLLKQDNVKLKGDVLLAATADEENMGWAGAKFLLSNHREKIFADYVLNEGGGSAIKTAKGNVFTINTAEKGILWFKIKAKGFPGHGSTPNMADNAVLRMCRVIDRLDRYRPKVEFVPTIKQFLDVIAKQDNDLQEIISRLLANPKSSDTILEELALKNKPLAEELRSRISMTINPTIIQGGSKENIIPGECECVFDCRLLPGQSIAETLDLIKDLISEADLDKLSFEIIQAYEGSESPLKTPLYKVIAEGLRNFEPKCTVSPSLMTGATDSRFFREAGSVCYGFQPMYPEAPINGKIIKREHGIDERISVENLVFGATVLYETSKKVHELIFSSRYFSAPLLI